jgi:hypothetical protein
MDNRLDRLLAQLRTQAADRDLRALEVDVQGRLARRARQGSLDFAPARATAVALALVMGAGVGGLTAATAAAATRPSIFAATDALAPSTLLEGRR